MDWHSVGPTVVTLALAFGAVLFARRFGGGAALENLERANRVLTARVGELEKQNQGQALELTALRQKTDVATAVAPVLQALAHHEESATRRGEAVAAMQDKMLTVLGMIADRLAPETE
jgi:hypothetical protein